MILTLLPLPKYHWGPSVSFHPLFFTCPWTSVLLWGILEQISSTKSDPVNYLGFSCSDLMSWLLWQACLIVSRQNRLEEADGENWPWVTPEICGRHAKGQRRVGCLSTYGCSSVSTIHACSSCQICGVRWISLPIKLTLYLLLWTGTFSVLHKRLARILSTYVALLTEHQDGDQTLSNCKITMFLFISKNYAV